MNVLFGSTAGQPDAGALKLQAASFVARSSRCRMPHRPRIWRPLYPARTSLTAAYWHVLNVDPKNPKDPLRDRFILSKGHAAAALYATLAMKGYIPLEELDTYCKDGGRLAEHPPANLLPGVEAATGSLGHGLPLGCGMALSGRIKGQSFPCLRAALATAKTTRARCGRRRCSPPPRGSRTSASSSTTTSGRRPRAPTRRLMLAPCATNGRRSAGTPARSTAMMSARWRGHAAVPNGSGNPVALIAHTVKGKGVSFMEDDNNWHYRAPTAEEVVRRTRSLA